MIRSLRLGLVGVALLATTGCSLLRSNASATPTTDPAGTAAGADGATTVAPATTPGGPAASTSAPPSPAAPVTAAPATTPPATFGAAQDLVVTEDVRTLLVAAGAATHNLPASDYTGLVAGSTFYAYDPGTNTYWAAGALAPSPSSQDAQVSVQDDGAYLVFVQPPGGGWKAYDVGRSGASGACPVSVPTAITALWQWPSGACRPA